LIVKTSYPIAAAATPDSCKLRSTMQIVPEKSTTYDLAAEQNAGFDISERRERGNGCSDSQSVLVKARYF